MHEPSLSAEEFETLKALTGPCAAKMPLAEGIEAKLMQLGLIEKTLDGYTLSSRGHARLFRDLKC